MSRGFIQLHRKIQDEWFWNDPRLVQTMIGLLLRANHEPKEVSFKGEKRLINRGEHITTYRDLANEWGCGRSTSLNVGMGPKPRNPPKKPENEFSGVSIA